MSRVFVVQRQHKLNKETGLLEPKFSLESAEEYGTIVHLLGPSVRPFRPEEIVRDLRHGLNDFNEDDYILPIGNPTLIGWAVAIAADMTDGIVNVLQWSGQRRKYIPIRADLEFEGGVPLARMDA